MGIGEADCELSTDPESPRLWVMIANDYEEVAAELEPAESWRGVAVYIRRDLLSQHRQAGVEG